MEFTTVQRLPYPGGHDAANGARQLQDLAEKLEVEFNSLDTQWTARASSQAWLVRTTAAKSSVAGVVGDADGVFGSTMTWDTVDYDNTVVGPINSGSSSIGFLGLSGRWETWFVGAYLPFTGGTTVGSTIRAVIEVDSIDPISLVKTKQYIRNWGAVDAIAGGGGGDPMTLSGMVRTRNGQVFVRHATDGAGTKTVAIGALFYAFRIGQE